MSKGIRYPAPEEVRQLPRHLRMTVPPEWEDRNGHVNVQYYQRLYELGGYGILDDIGFDLARCNAEGFGMFDLEHHIHYRAELLVGHSVSGYSRVLAVNEKRFQGMFFILNDSTERLACTIEYVTCWIDLGVRRTAPLPDDLLRGLRAVVQRSDILPWPVPRCGVMAP
ncbi:acyl-CoA thioesterase [Elongatibacter sediminis]|uniref:Thioesterase family protein n=1 Tax=Elongatibacter sediminis TaxID=3119006 RepID=A0AAW9RHQ1_9GAMM